MGRAWELRGSFVSDPGAVVAPTTAAVGDSFQVRNFHNPATAVLQSFIRQGATAGVGEVRSPLLHDNVKGIHAAFSESPAEYLLPAGFDQQLQAQDTLIFGSSGGAAEDEILGWSTYYSDLPGAQARLYSPGDIAGNIVFIDTVIVPVVNGATPAAWADTVMTTTDNLLHANQDYAVLGYMVDTVQGLVAIKGIDTSNLRVGGAGKIWQRDTASYFVTESERTGRPCIPVINAANAAATYVSTLDAVANSASNVTLILAQLRTKLG